MKIDDPSPSVVLAALLVIPAILALAALVFQKITWGWGVVGLAAATGHPVDSISFKTTVGALLVVAALRGIFNSKPVNLGTNA